jgi:toxin-antitoxin system PIN domain toxin
MIPDINLLVAASRADHVHHATAAKWLDDAIEACESGGSIEILPMVATGFLRLVTNARVFPDPTPVADAVEFIDALLSVAGVEMLEIGREWPTLCRLCRDGGLGGNDIPDAWIAAAVRTTHGHLVTFDGGFSRLLSKGELTVLAVAA